MSDIYEIIESEFDLIDDSCKDELIEFNFMPIKKAVFKLIAEHKKLQEENADLQDKLEDDGFVLVMGRDEQEELEKLRKENAELKKQSQWINVDDELPETDKLVMIYGELNYDFAKFNGEYWTRKAWPLGYIPKYWMPLPWCHL